MLLASLSKGYFLLKPSLCTRDCELAEGLCVPIPQLQCKGRIQLGRRSSVAASEKSPQGPAVSKDGSPPSS